VLIFDEVTTGFRMTDGGIHKLLGVNPDIAVFAKSMANGYAMAALVGTSPVMEAAQSTFISSTNWTERVGLAAAIATIRKIRRERVTDHLIRIGELAFAGWKKAAAAAGVVIHTEGLPCLTHIGFVHPDELTLMTLFTQDMLERGYLAFSQFKPSFAHQPAHVDAYMKAVGSSFAMIAEAVKAGDYASRLKGPSARRGFYRLTS
jgi:glutamate-1-semialdehyde 2,1-aminomutase